MLQVCSFLASPRTERPGRNRPDLRFWNRRSWPSSPGRASWVAACERERPHCAPGILPVNRFAEDPNLFFVVLDRRWRRRGDRRLLPKDMTKALKMQFANPVFHWQFPLLLGIGPVANQCIRPETQTLGHGDIVLVEPTELLGLRPIVPLWFFLGHPKRKRNANRILKRDVVVGNSLIGTHFVT